MHTILNDNLEKFLEGRLPAELQTSLESHLAECSSCRETADEAMESSQLLKLLAVTADDPAPEPMPGFALKVLESINSSATNPAAITQAPAFSIWSYLTGSFAMRQIVAAVAMLLILVSGYAFSLQASTQSTTAELLMDMPVDHEAPATLSMSAVHPNDDAKSICMHCWQHTRHTGSHAKAASITSHDNREQVMTALVAAYE